MTFDNSNKDVYNLVYIALGSNIENRIEHFKNAVKLIEKHLGKVVEKAPIYETEPFGFDSPYPFLNSAIRVESKLTPLEIIDILLSIETDLGRKRIGAGHSDRTIDLDFLVYNSLSFCLNQEKLILPHPRMLQRDFQYIPLIDIATPSLIEEIEVEKEIKTSKIIENNKLSKTNYIY